MGSAPSNPLFNCYFCNHWGPRFKLGCKKHAACERCLYKYVYDMLYRDKLQPNQIACPYCRIPLKKRQVRKVLSIKSLPDEVERPRRPLQVYRPTQRFLCKIDMNEHPPEEGIALRCRHYYCQDCLKLFLSNHVENGEVSKSYLKCPECHTPITTDELRYLLPKDLLERYWDFTIRKMNFNIDGEKLVICPNCSIRFTVSKKENYLTCPGCISPICVKCNVCHLEDDCPKDHDVEIEGVVKCPTCGEGLMKHNGCNFLPCKWKNCDGKTFVCYICGEKLTAFEHFSHFGRVGPFGNSCINTQ